MQFSKIIVSAVAFVGLASAQNASNDTTSNAAAPMGANNVLNAGLVGAAAAGALAFLV